MHRTLRRALGLGMVVVLSMAVGEARAQYYGGYGGYGWGGWGGSTVQGDIARGLGFYNIGAGIFNRETAVANSINADTIMRWNEYLYQSQQVANRREYERRAREVKRATETGDATYKRIHDNPEDRDIQNGDALNAILSDLTNPKVHSTALRLIRNPVSGRAIREIPFANASEAVTLSLAELTGEGDWPAALQGEAFAAERKAYQEAIAKALKEDEQGEITPQTRQEVDRAATRLRAKLEANKPADRVQYNEAANYIKALIAMSRMLDKPQVDKVIAELDSVKETSLGSLLSFMHAYNLRFGPATTPSQRTVYASLYPVMDEARDRVLKDLGDSNEGGKPVARDDRQHPVDFFQGLQLEQLDRGSSPKPAKP